MTLRFPVLGWSLVMVLTFSLFGQATGLAQEATPATGDPQAGSVDWPMLRGNPARTGVSAGPAPGGELGVRWRVETGGGVQSPAVADGVVYAAGDANYLFALDASTGAERWRFPRAAEFSSPAVADGVVVIGDDQGVVGVDAVTGEERWRVAPEDGPAWVYSSAAIVDGVAYIGAVAGGVYAIDVATGDVRWHAAGEPVFASPAVADNVVYAATEAVFSGSGEEPSAVLAFDAGTGEQLWRFDAPDEGRTFFSSPAVADGKVYIGSEGDGMPGALYALDAATGEERWAFHLSGSYRLFASPVVADGTVFAGSDGLHAIDAATGEQRWRLGMGEITSSPVIVDGVVYTAGNEGFLVAADSETGQELWHAAIGDPLATSDFRPSSPAISDGVFFVNGVDGYLYALGEEEDGLAAGSTPAAGASHAFDDAGVDSIADVTLGADQVPPAPVFLQAFLETWPAGIEYERNLAEWPGAIVWCVVSGTWAYTDLALSGDATPVAGGDEVQVGLGECATTSLGGPRLERNAGDEPVTLIQIVAYPYDYPGAEGQSEEITSQWLTGFDQSQLDLVGPPPWTVSLRVADLEPGGTILPYAGAGLGLTGGLFDATTHLSRRPDGSVRNIGEEPLAAYLFTVEPAASGAASPSPSAAAATAPSATPVPDAGGFATFLWQTGGGVQAFAGVTDIAIAPDGMIWVVDGQRNRFQIFMPDGAFVEVWGETGTGDGQFDFSRVGGDAFGAVAFAPDGSIYVADTGNRRIQKFAPDRSFVTAWGGYGTRDGELVDPIGVTTDREGNVYVVDDRRDDIQVFDADGAYLRTIGEHGSGPGQLTFTGNVAVDAGSNVYVADFGNNRVQVLGPDGAQIAAWGEAGSEPGQFLEPGDVAIDAEGNVYVVDSGNQRIQVFDRTSNLIGAWGSAGGGEGQFAYPIAIALDGAGHAYVTDIDNSRVQKFRLTPSDATPTP